jgi:hypothetical protein
MKNNQPEDHIRLKELPVQKLQQLRSTFWHTDMLCQAEPVQHLLKP